MKEHKWLVYFFLLENLIELILFSVEIILPASNFIAVLHDTITSVESIIIWM